MGDEYLREIHHALLIISDEIDRICRKNGIRYSLYGGTLIGAVRHKGFIPWDDDFDIAMLRADFDRFIEACKSDLSPEFNLVSIDNTEDYGYEFIKITLKGTRVLQGGYSKPKDYAELWVDVFPFDNVPDKRFQQFIQKNEVYFLIKLLEERFDGIHESRRKPSKIIFFKLLSFVNAIIPAEQEKKKLHKCSTKYNNANYQHVTSLQSPYGYYNEMLNKNIFDSLIEMEFEDRKYFAVKDYDGWLTKVYGDYMKLPPVEKRHTHNFVDYDMGKYCS